MDKKVNVWEEEILLPTYGIGPAEKNPMFLEKRVYQGSSGVVYPYPVIEKIEDTCEDKPYKAVFLENEYIKIMILPELGGRVQMAYDKIKERHFIYYNHVIKPALVGLTGPWISGGIEFNWPQHHRPSTFLPVDYTLEECEDGSAIVWVSERERMFHQKGMAGFVLRPGRAVLEIQGKLYNPTPLPQTFLWWANPAVAVNEHYQSVFPADVHAVFDHGKRDVSSYPIARGIYYKMDYSAGVDISRYKNIPVPTSYMAIQSKYDFVGGYENDTRAGVLHVANHNISPGKKQWTWGNGDFGQAWDRNLTDNDGPYIELMTGVFTDNQPDFTWLQPYEEKTFTQYFLPYRELGVVKNASADLLMNLEEEDGRWLLKIFATSLQKQLRVVVKKAGNTVFETVTDITPEEVFIAPVPIDSLKEIKIDIYNNVGKVLLYWENEPEEEKTIPEPAKAALDPEDISSTEALYLTGLHLEQYRHATYNPTDYYKEALRRDPGDARNNNALGLWLLRRGQFAQAEPYFRAAIQTLTERNPNPYDGEPYYNLGLSLQFQGKEEEAYASYYKACWNAAWQDAGYYSLAQISVARAHWEEALSEIDKSLVRNWHNHRARHLKTTILRHLGRKKEAIRLIHDSLEIDPFNFGCLYEQYLLSESSDDLDIFNYRIRKESRNYSELIGDYMAAGCWQEALGLADIALSQATEPEVILYYYKALCQDKKGQTAEAIQTIRKAEQQQPACCFPNQLEAIEALQTACRLEKQTPKALYLLGNLWYDKRQYPEAIAAWEQSIELDDQFPTVLRNLSLAYFNKLGKKEEAVILLEEALFRDTSDARILMEFHELYKRFGWRRTTRFALLSRYKDLVYQRDDLYLEYITLLNDLERYEEALEWIMNRKFHPWEGGEGKVPGQYLRAKLELARQCIKQEKYEKALSLIEDCYIYPPNLGEGKLHGARENDFDYYKGCILKSLKREEEAIAAFRRAAQGNMEPNPKMYYNDQQSDKIFYQGLALQILGDTENATKCFRNLIRYGEEHKNDKLRMDYFAVSLPDLQIWESNSNTANRIHCYSLMELGYLGLGDKKKVQYYRNKIKKLITPKE